jgi:hypothetical protein
VINYLKVVANALGMCSANYKNKNIMTAKEHSEDLAKRREEAKALHIGSVIPRYVYRKLQKNEHYSVMEIGENDNPRTHPNEWCDRRVCEGFWGDEEEAKRWVAKMNEV